VIMGGRCYNVVQSSPSYRREKAEGRERPGNVATPASKGSKAAKSKKVHNMKCIFHFGKCIYLILC